MTNRKLKEMGFIPVVAYLLIVILFLAISFYLFERVDYAQYIYSVFPLFFLSRLSDRQRNDFLKITFRERQYKTIRLIENVLVTVPFALFLCWERCFLSIIPLIVISILFGLVNVKKAVSIVLPTPFSKHPFEFSIGFRNTFYLFPVPYYLTAMAIVHNNFNLGIVALVFLFFLICTFYFRSDNSYYVWIFNLSPTCFLRYKIKKAILYTFSLCLPILLSLSLFYWQNSWILLLGFLWGCIFLTMVIYAKYAAYPDDIGVSETLILVFSAVFPLMIFHFRNKAIEQLKTVLK